MYPSICVEAVEKLGELHIIIIIIIHSLTVQVTTLKRRGNEH